MTMIDMTRKLILPAIEAYSASVAESLGAKLGVVPELSGKYEKEKLKNSPHSRIPSTLPFPHSSPRSSVCAQ